LKKCQEKSLELTTNSLTFARIARGESEKVLSAILLNKEADRTLLHSPKFVGISNSTMKKFRYL